MKTISAIAAVACCLLLAGCPSSTPTTHQVLNSWVQNAQPPDLAVVSQKLYRAQSCHSASPGKVTAFASSVKSATDTSVTSGASYFYWMTIVDNLGRESAPSSCVVATIP